MDFHGYNANDRYERKSNTTAFSKSVLIVVHNAVLLKPIPISNNHVEVLFVLIKFSKRNLVISSA